MRTLIHSAPDGTLDADVLQKLTEHFGCAEWRLVGGPDLPKISETGGNDLCVTRTKICVGDIYLTDLIARQFTWNNAIKVLEPANMHPADQPKSSAMSRAELLDTAKSVVTKDRAATHGKPEDSFAAIAAYWSVHLGITVTSVDVSIMMALLKVARLGENPAHADNWIDLAGYAACGGEIALATESCST